MNETLEQILIETEIPVDLKPLPNERPTAPEQAPAGSVGETALLVLVETIEL